ncbi:MAG: hypothetical protein AAF725_08405 [Acidobacteriota bacterium]
MTVFRITLWPGHDGDCVLMSWGPSPDALRHALIDLGRASTYRKVRPRLEALGDLELFVMSHVDADHIAGAMPLVREDNPPFAPRRVWFNAREHLETAAERRRGLASIESLGAVQGERLDRGLRKFRWPWNRQFESRVVSTDSPEAGAPLEIAAGLRLRLLSPGDEQLDALRPSWDADVHRAGLTSLAAEPEILEAPRGFEVFGTRPNVEELAAERYERDTTRANGTSIAFLAEYAGRRALLAADAHSEVLEEALEPLARAEGGRLRLDLLKVSHHGSKANTSPDFLRRIDCRRFAFSTNGARHEHPDPQTVARVLAADPLRDKVLYFNYRQPSSELWESRWLERRWRYRCVMPDQAAPEGGTLAIEL